MAETDGRYFILTLLSVAKVV